MSKVRSFLVLSLFVVGVAACDNIPTTDGGVDADTGGEAGADTNVTVCVAASDCDNGLFCDGDETCAPGSPGAGADGCVAGTPPCAASACDEGADVCSCDDPDGDGDGHDAEACGGDDCDDTDNNRYPGNEEVCDTEGHDEDCVETTVGDTDVDTDGFIDAMCCNTVYGTCGDDCDDGDVNVNPGASEMCNGTDDNCSGGVDEMVGGAPTLCPGGACVTGRCNFTSWDIGIPLTGDESASRIDMDFDGNVYVTAVFRETIQIGGMTFVPETGAVSERDVIVVSFSPTGAFRWARAFQSAEWDYIGDVKADKMEPIVYVRIGVGVPAFDPGGGERSLRPFGDLSFVVALNSADGTYLWDYAWVDSAGTNDSYLGRLVAVPGGGVVLASAPRTTISFDSGASEWPSVHLVQFATSGTVVWERGHGDHSVQQPEISDLILSSGNLAVVGTFRSPHDFGGGLSSPSGRDYFVAAYDATNGAYQWLYHQPSGGTQQAVAGASDGLGGVYFLGSFLDDAIIEPGVTDPIEGQLDGFLAHLDAAGAYDWHRVFHGMTAVDAFYGSGLTLDAEGVVAVGGFQGRLDFGSRVKIGAASPEFSGFVAAYGPSGLPRWDIVYSASPDPSAPTRLPTIIFDDVVAGPGNSTAIVGDFGGIADFGSGSGPSLSRRDTIVVRLAD